MDFTVTKYKQLLQSLIGQRYAFQTFEEFLRAPREKAVILRHDVDLLPFNSLAFARIQAESQVKGVYYFRAVPQSWNVAVIKEIAALGHEIGYHYECLTTCKGNMDKAVLDFEKNLSALRELAPVSTICMHGSPMSKYDSKDLWKNHDYRRYGITGEPYFDVDFNKVFYLTDTGRRWDGHKVSVRDKVHSSKYQLSFHTTQQIIQSCNSGSLPQQIMFTFHPQRWSNNPALWTKELVVQHLKNQVKRFIANK
jgi:hypothetical protein